MSHLLLLNLLLHLCVSAKHSGLEETVKDDLEETKYKNEKLDDIENNVEDLENKLETKNVNLQNQLKEMKVQFTEIESRVEEVI